MMRRGQRRRGSAREDVRAIYKRVFNRPPPLPKDAIDLGKHPHTDERAWIRASDLDTHLQFIGGSRKGKTNALRRLFKQLLKAKKECGEGITIIDPHGGLAQYALELCAEDPGLASDVLYMSLKDVEHILSINPLRGGRGDPYFQAACVKEGLIKVFDEARSQDKKLVSRVLVNLSQALIELNLTLLESRHFLSRSGKNDGVLASFVEELPEGDLRSYWYKYLKMRDESAEMHAMGPANRLDDLIRPPVLRRMIGQTSVSVDFLEVMDRGVVSIFDTSIGKDTEITADGQALFNALLVQQYRQAFPRRTEKGARDYDPKQTPPHTLILDEFGSYMSTEFARTLTEASKFGLRVVFAHQNLQQLIPADGDKRLLHAVLAIPNKAVFGNLSYDEAETLAKHMYLADLDPDEIKYQGENVTWDPVLKWGVTGEDESDSDSTGRASNRSSSSSRRSSSGRSMDPDGEVIGRQAGDDMAYGDVAGDVDIETSTHGRTVKKGYYTDHEMRIQKQPPIHRTVEEQVFRFAQAMSTNERGVAVIGTENQKPVLCRFPNMDKRPVNEEELGRFVEAVRRKPYYLSADQAERLIEERQMKLLEAGKPQVEVVSKRPIRRKAPTRRRSET